MRTVGIKASRQGPQYYAYLFCMVAMVALSHKTSVWQSLKSVVGYSYCCCTSEMKPQEWVVQGVHDKQL